MLFQLKAKSQVNVLEENFFWTLGQMLSNAVLPQSLINLKGCVKTVSFIFLLYLSNTDRHI